MKTKTRVVHKYVLADESNTVETHRGAVFLHADNQYEQITVWAEVDTRQPKVQRQVDVVGTGHQVRTFGEYLGSVLMRGGMFVFHIYVEPEELS